MPKVQCECARGLLAVLDPGLPDGVSLHEFMAASPRRAALQMNSLVERVPATRTAACNLSIFITPLSAHLVNCLLLSSCPIYLG